MSQNNSKSKLSSANQKTEIPSEKRQFNPTLRKSFGAQLKTFRLREIDVENLYEAIKRINTTGKIQPINATDLIRGLLTMAQSVSEDKLINFIRMSY